MAGDDEDDDPLVEAAGVGSGVDEMKTKTKHLK